MESESERQVKKWEGFQADKKDLPDRPITGRVATVTRDFKSVTIILDNPRAVIAPGDIFYVFLRRDEYLKAGVASANHHKDHRTARVRVTRVEAGTITGDIDHDTMLHPIGPGDRAIARSF